MQELIALTLDPEIVADMDDRRGGLRREDFVRFCVGFMLSRDRLATVLPSEDPGEGAAGPSGHYVTRQDFEEFKCETEKMHLEFSSLAVRYCNNKAAGCRKTEDCPSEQV